MVATCKIYLKFLPYRGNLLIELKLCRFLIQYNIPLTFCQKKLLDKTEISKKVFLRFLAGIRGICLPLCVEYWKHKDIQPWWY